MIRSNVRVISAAILLLFAPLATWADSESSLKQDAADMEIAAMIAGRNPQAPLSDMKECLHGSDFKMNPAGMPHLRPSEAVRIACRDIFIRAADGKPDALIFASTNILVGFESAKKAHGRVGAWWAGKEALANETLSQSQRMAELEALAYCRNYAIDHRLEPGNCKVVGSFEAEQAAPDENPVFRSEGGVWSRALSAYLPPQE